METAAVVMNARVDTDPDGSLVVSWVLDGEPTAVDVAVGSTPDHLDHVHQITVPAGRTSWRLAGPHKERLFVSVAPHGSGSAVVTTDRRVGFQGITNFRDLGGYRSRSGGRVRWGMVFRADALHGLVADDLVLYEQLGVRRVYDLRSDEERAERPNHMESEHLTVLSRPAGSDMAAPPAHGDSVADGERILAQMYKGLLDHAAAQIGRLLTGMADEGGLPAVFHCHAGKDRTGVVAAVLLDVLGVDRSDILEDYELTARYRLRSAQESTFERLIQSGLLPEAAAGVLTTPRWAMEEALAHLDERYDGVEEYLTGPCRMRPEVLATLRTRLVDDVS